MYEGYGAGTYLGFVPPLGWTQAWPPGGARTDSPYLQLSFGNDPFRHTALMDTGSTGVVVAMRYIDRPEQYQNLGAGSITYTSSGNVMNGEWLVMPLTIRGANGGAIRTDPMRVLAVTSVTCTSYQRTCTPIADPAQVNTLMIGIGFGREADSQAQGTPTNNPFLNVVNETGAASRRGYVLTKDGINVGLTPASTAGAFAYTKLLPYPGIPDEWSQAPACVAFGNNPAACGGIALVDTGVTTMYLSSVLEPADGVTLGETATGQRKVLPGTVLTFFLPGQGQVTYTFTPGDPANPLLPKGGVNFDGSDKTFFNTSVMFLNGFDYLYDADGGFVGYRWTGEASPRYGSVIPRMALTGSVVLGNGFRASLPATLMADSTLVPQGSALLSGAIEGEAGLVINGLPGSVVALTGQNRYTGGTTVSAGTLAVSRDANLGARSGALTLDGGTLRADASFTTGRAVSITGNNGAIDTKASTVTLSGSLSGPGGLIKNGAGMLALAGTARHQGGTLLSGVIEGEAGLVIDGLPGSVVALTGQNRYTGGTTVSAGTLAVSRDANLGARSGGLILDGGTLRADASFATGRAISITGNDGAIDTKANTLTLSGSLSGPGGLVKNGAGTLALAGTARHQGGTVINAGTLSVGDGGTRGSLGGHIQNNGILAFNRSDDIVFNGTITGRGAVALNGEGSVTFAGPQLYRGQTAINGGTLIADTTLPGSVAVGSGGTLAGNGSHAGLAVRAGGTVSPGHSIGRIDVRGDLSFAAGSVYETEILSSRADRIVVGGRATLAGGTVRVQAAPGFYALGSLYPILTARGGVEGAFTDVAVAGEPAPFLTFGLIASENGVSLQSQANAAAIGAAGANANQRATAAAVAALPWSSPVLGALAYAVDDATVSDALGDLSGEVHAAAIGAAVADARLVERSVLSRLRETPNVAGLTAGAGDLSAAGLDPRGFSLWGMGLGSWGRVESTANGAGYDTSTGGFLLGADVSVAPDVTLGVAGGFTRTRFDLEGRLSSGTDETVYGVVYGAARWGAVALRLGGSLARLDIDTNRSVVIPGFADALSASRNGTGFQAFGELGYRIAWAGVAFEPFVGGSVLRLMMDGFGEAGGPSALIGTSRTSDLGTTTLGLRAQAEFGEGSLLTLSGMIGWRHAYGDVTPDALLAFGSGPSFAVAGVPVDRDALVTEAGIDWQAMRDLTLGVSYSGQAGQRAQDHAVKGNLTWRF